MRHKENLRKLMLQKLANDIADGHIANKTQEDIAIIMRALEREQKLMERGVRMLPSVNAPSDIKQIAPDYGTVDRLLLGGHDTDDLGKMLTSGDKKSGDA